MPWTPRQEEQWMKKQRNFARQCTQHATQAMPRTSTNKDFNRPVYWWNPDIAELREKCSQARRRFARVQSRRWTQDEEEVSHTYRSYRVARRALQWEIKNAKIRSWKELIGSVESDVGTAVQNCIKQAKTVGLPTDREHGPGHPGQHSWDPVPKTG
jgi:hypothetical protein